MIQQKDLRQWLAECNVDMDKVNINFVSESQKGVDFTINHRLFKK